MIPMLRASVLLALSGGMSAGAVAQGTGTVASPIVKSESSISSSTGVAYDDGDEGFAQRFDYRVAVGNNWRVSGFVFFNDRGGDFRYRRLALEAMHQFVSSDDGWNSALQIRGRLPDGSDGPGRVRVAWLNRWRPTEKAELRLIGLASQELGKDQAAGIGLETRAEATWQIAHDTRVGAQIFNRYNTTADFGSFETQRHSLGAVVKGALTDDLSYRVNALAGLSEAAEDFELRVRLRLKI
ncbi:MAG: hypothetical protein ABJH52_05980 [Henriciella sp.]